MFIGDSIETSESARVKSVENEMSKALEKETTTDGIQNPSTVEHFDKNYGEFNGPIVLPSKLQNHPEVIQQTNGNPTMSTDISKAVKDTYKETISEYSNRKYDIAFIFPSFKKENNSHALEGNTPTKSKIFPRSMKPYGEYFLLETDKDLEMKLNKSDDEINHYRPNTGRTLNTEDYVEGSFNSFELDDDEFHIQSNELFADDQSSKSKLLHLARGSKNDINIDQRNREKFSFSKGKNRGKDLVPKKHPKLLNINYDSLEYELIDDNEEYDGDILEIPPRQNENRGTVCSCYKIGTKNPQSGCTHSANRNVIILNQSGSSRPGTNNINSSILLSQLLRNIGDVQTLSRADENNDFRDVLVLGNSVVGSSCSRNQNAAQNVAFARNSEGISIVEISPRSINTATNNANIAVAQIPVVGSSLQTIQTGTQNVNNANILVSQNSQNINTAGPVPQQTTNLPPIQTTTQNVNNANILDSQNSQNINTAGPVPQQINNLTPIQTTTQNVNNANVLVGQNSQNINTAGPVPQQTNLTPIQTITQNVNNTNVLVSQISQNINTAGPVPQQTNLTPIQTTTQNVNNTNVLVSQISQNINTAGPVPQQTNLTPIQTTTQNVNNANILDSQNSQNINTAGPVPQQINNLTPIQTTTQNVNNANVLVSQNSQNINTAGPISQQSTNLTPIQTTQNVNNANVLVTQNSQNINTAGPVPQQTNNLAPIQTTQNVNNANVLVNQNSQNINTAGSIPQQSTNLTPFQTTNQNVNNTNVLVTQNSQNINTAGPVPQQSTNLTPIQTTTQNVNSANVLVTQNSQNINTAGSVPQQTNLTPIQTTTQNVNNANVLVGQNSQNINTAGPISQQSTNLTPIQTTTQNVNNANVLVSQNSQNINSAGVLVTQQATDLTPVQPATQNVNNANIALAQSFAVGSSLQSILTESQSSNNANVLVNQNSVPQNTNNAGVLLSQQSTTPLQVETQNVNNANVLVSQNSQTVNSGGLVTQQSTNLTPFQTSSQNVNNANIAISQNSAVGSSFQTIQTATKNNNANVLINQNSVPQNMNTADLLVSQQSTNLIPVQTATQNIDNVNVMLNRNSQNINNAGVLVTGVSPLQTTRNIDIANILMNRNSVPQNFVPSSNIIPLAITQNPSIADILVNQQGRNVIGVQQFTTPLRTIDRGDSGSIVVDDHGGVVQLGGSPDLVGPNLLRLQPNGLIAISTIGNPDFTIIPPLSSNKCSCASILPPNLSNKDNILIVIPGANELNANKVFNTVTGSNNQPFNRADMRFNAEQNGFTLRPQYEYYGPNSHSANIPIRKPANPFSKSPKLIDGVYEDVYAEERDFIPLTFNAKPLGVLEASGRMKPKPYEFRTSDGELPAYHNQPYDLGVNKGRRLYKYEPKVTY
ncbi:hypothetical protein M8J76_011206 [Diaphorina citri]|nr:hypothetical protein M8J76_011206 [Diaphorina citri]